MKLIVLLNLLLVIIFAWSAYALENGRNQLEQANGKQSNCQSHAIQIESCRDAAEGLGIAEAGYDCSSDIMRMIRQQNIRQQKSISPRGFQTSEDGYVVKTIDNPINEPVQLKQLIKLLAAGEKNAVKIFAESIELGRPSQKSLSNQPEKWSVLDLRLKHISKTTESK